MWSANETTFKIIFQLVYGVKWFAIKVTNFAVVTVFLCVLFENDGLKNVYMTCMFKNVKSYFFAICLSLLSPDLPELCYVTPIFAAPEQRLRGLSLQEFGWLQEIPALPDPVDAPLPAKRRSRKNISIKDVFDSDESDGQQANDSDGWTPEESGTTKKHG